MLNIADEVFLAYAVNGGSLEALTNQIKNQKITTAE